MSAAQPTIAVPTPPQGYACPLAVQNWVREIAALAQPAEVRWLDGSYLEYATLLQLAQAQGVIQPLDQSRWPGSYYSRSHPSDVARIEERTVICTPTADEAGPTNHWADPAEMKTRLMGYIAGAFAGKTMYVVPYLMGPPGSRLAKVGIELTDSIYVAISMRVMTRMGRVALDQLGSSLEFNRGLHATLGCDLERRWIAHFPQENLILSTGSNYGGNVLLGKKCLALRIGSWLGHRQGWLAEHMLILKVESPTGEVNFVAAAFPSACGKTNFAMLIPPKAYQGWKVTTIGDDIAWMRIGADGRLYAINPENGYFGVAPGTSHASNPNAMATLARDTIFTNVGLSADGAVWWEGLDGPIPENLKDWKGNPWKPGSPEKCAHPNSRFASPMINNPALAAEVNDPNGVPISAIIFGGRRATTYPLVIQAFNWTHGVYLGATLGSETTAAAAGTLGQVRRDPMAMLPFCGYHMGDYLNHWLHIGRKLSHPPRIFHVNWFRKGTDGKFLWPGFGDNMRVLEWICARTHGHGLGEETPLGWMPAEGALRTDGLAPADIANLAKIQAIDKAEWDRELELQSELFQHLGDRMPKPLIYERELLKARLG